MAAAASATAMVRSLTRGAVRVIAQKMQSDFLGVQFKSTKVRKLYPRFKQDLLDTKKLKDKKEVMADFVDALWQSETSVAHPFTKTLNAMREADMLLGTPPPVRAEG